MIELIRKILNRKYKKEELIKRYEEQKLTDVAESRVIRRGRGCGLGS